jgi:hypothetical protein
VVVGVFVSLLSLWIIAMGYATMGVSEEEEEGLCMDRYISAVEFNAK